MLGELCISENERRLVSPEAWSKLQQYFPKAPEFPSHKECCSQCKVLSTRLLPAPASWQEPGSAQGGGR